MPMIYKINFDGHEILFWPICSVRTLWMASDNFLIIDGKLAAKSGGACFSSRAKATLQYDDIEVPVEMRTKSSSRPFHVDYQLIIGEEQIDSGTLRMSCVWKLPQSIEQEAAQQLDKLHV
jgi:hypothetical protein